MPKCQMNCNKDAIYDSKTCLGPWAYLCITHYKMYGSKTFFTKFREKEDIEAAVKEFHKPKREIGNYL